MNVAIIGSGTMGTGIAQIAAMSDCAVQIYDKEIANQKKSEEGLKKILTRLVEKNRITQKENEQILANIVYINSLESIKDADLVIEAIIENEIIKKEVFKNIEALVSPSCIIASNTSSLSISALASSCEKPDRFIGLHFFNPAPIMKLVEIIPAIQTHPTIVNQCNTLLQKFGKTTVIAKDTPGFIVNKVARPFYSEALRIYEEGIASFATIDEAMKTIAGFRMGPFELMDYIGNDVNYAVTESVFTSFYYDPRYKPSFTQKRYAEAGYLGRKSGKGFYEYEEGKAKMSPDDNKELQTEIADRVIIMLINEAADTLHMNIANAQDIEIAMTKGVNYPKGLLAWANEIGIKECVYRMDAMYDFYHEDRYRCSPLLRSMSSHERTFNV